MQGSVLSNFIFSASVIYLVISCSLMALNSTNMPTTFKFMSALQISSLNSGLINLTVDFPSVLGEKYLKHNLPKLNFSILHESCLFHRLLYFSNWQVGISRQDTLNWPVTLIFSQFNWNLCSVPYLPDLVRIDYFSTPFTATTLF